MVASGFRLPSSRTLIKMRSGKLVDLRRVPVLKIPSRKRGKSPVRRTYVVLAVVAFVIISIMFAGISFVFQMAHTVEGTTHPLPNEQNTIENDWAIHQMNTTVDFSPRSKIISWYVGGLNFQVEHHLFPRICHVHYPEIAKIVKQTADEFGVPYLVNDTFLKALKSHLSALKKFGTLPDASEVIV